jgi:DNA recombination protein RmuC
MLTNILIVVCALIILIALYFFTKPNSNNQENETKVKVELSSQFESTLENIKSFVADSTKKTEENWSMFKSFESMMNNRQERGSFHQKEMEDILRDRLPAKFLEFQKGLPNGKIVDALVNFEEDNLRFCIDSKSIFESFDALRNAQTRPDILKAEKAFSDDVVKKNAKKISEDYIIPGYTTDYALMFIRSENVFSAIYNVQSTDIVGDCLKLKVIPVSPTYLWALVNNLKEFLKDKNYVERAKEIKKNISFIKEDILIWTNAVTEVQTKFDKVGKDFRAIHRASLEIKDRTDKLDEIENNKEAGKEIT